ncbi:DUF3616 domain-containing protein [Spirulina sp. CS-785/01]|uniref:DUF3616 domain-containing protein n=1 Tax=Spirulina sp. CS-785/01 TaxID=3021716 RepID=UPI002331079F|nr:DUF3616 domain-containing protein [Spirulina sp. CS-785/01]MDB9313091.1 DUF3616 domain-containing protein [Spirulina sp. CS-785/01]
MTAYLYQRLRLQFDLQYEGIEWGSDLSAIAQTPDHLLWFGSDEATSIECLSPLNSSTFGNHRSFPLNQIFPDIDPEQGEVDIEGLKYNEGYIWVVGSHSSKRSKAKGKKVNKGELVEIEREPNRYLLGRIPVQNSALVQRSQDLTAACLQREGTSNRLMVALAEDEMLGSIISSNLPSKDNGFDIEGIAVSEDRIFLGLRGPVLRGIAILLELKVKAENGILELQPIGKEDQLYRQHFLDLGGMGIRDLCWHGEDLLVLAGPTMDLDGTISVYRLPDPLDLKANRLASLDNEKLAFLFEIPHSLGGDRAEGIIPYTTDWGDQALLAVYDSPHPNRVLKPGDVLADLWKL